MKKLETVALENALMDSTIKRLEFGVPEVTIGWYGNKRVDFLLTNTRGIVKCYEIKVTKADFHSKHGHTFVGHYNYYVMTPELWRDVKKEVPERVGVLVGTELKCVKKALRQDISDDSSTKLVLYLARSMAREVKKNRRSESKEYLAGRRRKLEYFKREVRRLKNELRRGSRG